jgi:putative hemolysin
MPSPEFHADDAREQVLSRLAEFPGLAARLAPVKKIRDLYRRVQQRPDGFRLENLLAEMRINIRIESADFARIPALGPVVVVANHPFGVLDGAILTSLLTRARADIKVLTNYLLGDVPELRQHCIFVDPFQTDRSIDANRKALREALGWLQRGGMLAVFPAGEVSHWQMPAGGVVDPHWNDTAVRLIRRTGAAALPVFFCGQNSVKFQVLGMIHPRLRSAFLLQEFFDQRGRTIEARVGSAIPPDAICALGDSQAIAYLRWRTYLLARRTPSEASNPSKPSSKSGSRVQKALADPISAETLAREIKALPADRLLSENGDFAVYAAQALEIRQLLLEIARLRELTFRQVGEGTGRSRDLDSFDEYYSHLLLWNRAKQELVGAYRAANTAEVVVQRGVRGLYTSTLFRYDARLFEVLGPALELGRSFVRPEYQRQYAPLLLLWKGIARLVAMHPETPVLFGAVSISNNYSDASREMIYRFFESRMQGDDLAGFVHPRRPFRPKFLRSWDCRSMTRALHDLEQLSEPITDVEPDGKGLPILLRQYAKVGGKMLAFNVDRKFSNVLDGLVMVDLRRTDPAILDRYMGREAAVKFRRVHGMASTGHSAISSPVAGV